MRIAEKVGDLPIFATDILNFFFLSIAGITSWPMGKIDLYTPITEGLIQAGSKRVGWKPIVPESISLTIPEALRMQCHEGCEE